MIPLHHRVIWTVLPRGVEQGRARLVALASIRLIAEGPATLTLADFPAFADWPAAVEDAAFQVFVDDKPVAAQRDLDPLVIPSGAPGSSADWWAALFGKDTPVDSHAVDDLTGAQVVSYDPAALEAALSDFYGSFAASLRGAERPSLGTLGNALKGKDAGFFFDHAGAVGPLDAFVAALAPKTAGKPPATAQAAAAKFDFHARLSAVGQHAALLHRLRLAVPLSFDAHDLPHPGAVVRVRVNWAAGSPLALSLPNGAPGTAVSHAFHARPRTEGLIVGGFLDPEAAGLSVVQTDVEGGVRKLHGLQATADASADAEYQQGKEALADNPDSQPTTQPAGLPVLRSQGFALTFSDQAARLKAAFAGAVAMDAAFQPPTAVTDGAALTFFAEDLTRGFRVDVLDETAGQHHWRSLHWRHEEFAAKGLKLEVDSAEGLVRGALAQQGIGAEKSPVMAASPALAVWTGWSLSAPHPAKHVGAEDAGPDLQWPQNEAVEGLELATRFSGAKGLPSLRYGREYRFRVRAVDLAGGSWGQEATTPHVMADAVKKALLHAIPSTPPQVFHRLDPVEAPVLTFVTGAGGVDGPEAGESMARMAIRTVDAAGPAKARRMVFPPRVAFDQAERHGDLDDAGTGRIDPGKVAMLRQKDNLGSGLPTAPVALEYVRDGAGKSPNPEAETPVQLTADPAKPVVPYLSDGLAGRQAIRLETVRAAGHDGAVLHHSFGGQWPDREGFVIELADGDAAPHFVAGASPATLRVSLPAGETVRLHLSALLSSQQLDLMGVWRWAKDRLGGETRAQELALAGQHWMLTPRRTIELVHAVQRPLTVPAFEPRKDSYLDIRREAGAREAQVLFDTKLHLNSTRHLDVFADWTDPADDGRQEAPGSAPKRAHAFNRPVTDGDYDDLDKTQLDGQPRSARLVAVSGAQQLPDTRARFLTYSASATSRFREYMPPKVRAAKEDGPDGALSVTSAKPAAAWAPSSQRPPAPQIVSVVPTFGWEHHVNGEARSSLRRGGGLRIYLERPWFSSGFNEMLAVCFLYPHPELKTLAGPDLQARLTTQWGQDPIFFGGDLADLNAVKLPRAVYLTKFAELKRPAFFTGQAWGKPYADAFDALPHKLFRPLATPPGHPELLLGAAPHLVDWDPVRRLWFCDIEMDLGAAYAPFVRLALARYQPMSIARTEAKPSAPLPAGHWADQVGVEPPASPQLEDLHLSEVVTTDFVQLLPDRFATVVRPHGQAGVIDVRVYGIGGQNRLADAGPSFDVVAEKLIAGADPAIERAPVGFTLEPIPPHEPGPPAPAGGAKIGGAKIGDPAPGAPTLPEGDLYVAPDLPLLYETRVRLTGKNAKVRVSLLEYETYKAEPKPRRRLVYYDEFDL